MSAMAPAEAPQVAVKPSRKKPPTQGDSFCGKPELVNGTTDTFKVSCLGPGIPLAPGQVAPHPPPYQGTLSHAWPFQLAFSPAVRLPLTMRWGFADTEQQVRSCLQTRMPLSEGGTF